MKLLSVDVDGWLAEVADIKTNHYPKFGDRLPKQLSECLAGLEERLKAASNSHFSKSTDGPRLGAVFGSTPHHLHRPEGKIKTFFRALHNNPLYG